MILLTLNSGLIKKVEFFVNKYRGGKLKNFNENLIYQLSVFYSKTFKNSIFKEALFYPEYPRRGYVIYKILKHLGYSITNNPNKNSDILIHWQDKTLRETTCVELSHTNKIEVNKFSNNISKQYTDSVFESVFNCQFTIDPTKHTGKVVRKSNNNASHDGVVIECPIEKSEPEYVYQRLINNYDGENLVLDVRVVIIKNTIPLIYKKWRSISSRFSNSNLKVVIVEDVNSIFSKSELDLILEFTKTINLDYGELDIVRDVDTNKIYILDVNNTPNGPPKQLPKQEKKKAIKIMADSFKKQFLYEDF